ncbi:uncharacterized protein LOC131949908 [Physella acuta]|uniref:uncharacterized protein LOC131949908 n=1 Tax=Physella acuta TaxID=109671 RepID=UPI0027DBADD7|nr:uncharacterized protein LOC131949908 [Physella acuta]
MDHHRRHFSRTSSLIPLMVFILDYVAVDVIASTTWEHLSLRYGTWYRPPKTPAEAVAMSYKRVNDICSMDTYHGFLYVHPHNDKSRLIFDYNDNLAGIQAVIPGNMFGFNTNNESVKFPTNEVMPPILLSLEQYSPGVQMYTITAYFKHPSLVCGPYTPHAHSGKGLYIQMGYRVERQFEKIPLEARHLSDEWKTGTCLPSMGRHYFKNLSRNLQCERLYPVFLMYNDEGQLGGFGWLFQGVPPSESPRSPVKWFKHSVQFYPAIFDQTMLPPCMFNPEFHVFGIRIYLRNEHTMTCPRHHVPGDSDDYGDNLSEDTDESTKTQEVTFRPLFNREPSPSLNSTVGPRGAPKYMNPKNNIIVDDVTRGKNNRASMNNVSLTLMCALFFFSITNFLSASSLIHLKHSLRHSRR